MFNGANLSLSSDVDQDRYGKVTKIQAITTHKRAKFLKLRTFGKFELSPMHMFKVSKCAKIRNRYNQVPHLTQDTNGKVTNSQ